MKNNSQISNKLNESIKTSNYCEICQKNKAQYKCEECPKFKIFCKNCSSYIHSMESNTYHNLSKLNDSSENLYQSNTDTKSNCKIATENYLDQLKMIYKEDKNNLLNENYTLKERLNSDQKIYKHKINNLENKLNEIKLKNENNIRMMKDNHQFELKKITTEKNFDINYLNNNNKDLEQRNNELKNILKEKMEQYSKSKSEYNEILSTLEFGLYNSKKENYDIKEFYENKINYLIDNYNTEKSNIIK